VHPFFDTQRRHLVRNLYLGPMRSTLGSDGLFWLMPPYEASGYKFFQALLIPPLLPPPCIVGELASCLCSSHRGYVLDAPLRSGSIDKDRSLLWFRIPLSDVYTSRFFLAVRPSLLAPGVGLPCCSLSFPPPYQM